MQMLNGRQLSTHNCSAKATDAPNNKCVTDAHKMCNRYTVTLNMQSLQTHGHNISTHICCFDSNSEYA